MMKKARACYTAEERDQTVKESHRCTDKTI